MCGFQVYSKVIQFYIYIYIWIYGFFFYKFIYFLNLFLAVFRLCCCTWAFSGCGKRGPLFVSVGELLTAVASLVAEHGL